MHIVVEPSVIKVSEHSDHHPNASSIYVWQLYPYMMETILTILLIRLSQVFVQKWNREAGAPDT